MTLLAGVQAYISRYRLMQPGATVVVGVSGGPDSLTLLDLLRCLAESWGLRLVVAHLHHGIRGAAADADAEFVAGLATAWGLPCRVERVSLPAIAAQQRLALEEAARRVRYAFLARVAQEVSAPYIAVGHNADDQAETVLMHLLRGAGPAGLRGMLPATRLCDYRFLLEPGQGEVGPPGFPADTHIMVVRPLLETSRADIEAYCELRELHPRLDHSNLDTTFFRNRLRHEVLPYLANLNPQISQRLCNLAEVIRADYSVLEAGVDAAWRTLCRAEYGDAVEFDLAGWRAQPLATRRSLIRRACYRLERSLRDVGFVHVEYAVKIAQQGGTGAQATLPHGLVLTVGYTTLTIGAAEALHLPPDRPWLASGPALSIRVPGTTSLPGGWQVTVEDVDTWDWPTILTNPDPLCAWLDADVVGAAPVLRTRAAGDQFQPHGMSGSTVHLSDFLINVKLPEAWRDSLPLLEAAGQILWVVGLRLSETVLVCPQTRCVRRVCFRLAA